MAAWERQALLEAGLGEKKISIGNIDCNAEEFREKLLEEFPKLKEGGGFELLRCSAKIVGYWSQLLLWHCRVPVQHRSTLVVQKSTSAQFKLIWI